MFYLGRGLEVEVDVKPEKPEKPEKIPLHLFCSSLLGLLNDNNLPSWQSCIAKSHIEKYFIVKCS
jgi:hypothetical protein